jgi:Asp/Glu/hydantoin racemase
VNRRILVINPNSNVSVTRGLEKSLVTLCKDLGVEVECHTIAEAPFGIESDEDIEQVAPLVVEHIGRHPGFDAYVIACYSDPGLAEARRTIRAPVLGIHESATALCAAQGRHFGVLALGRDSIQRHIAYVRQLGFQAYHAGERPMDISVDEAANDPATLDKIIENGRLLIEEDGAEAVILGCAGLAAWREDAQRSLGIPVIDPVMAAVSTAADI